MNQIPLEAKSPTIISRASVIQPLKTGNHIIDNLFPLGLGQRQLIIGDNSTGKTSLSTTIVISQKNSNDKNNLNGNGKNRVFVIYNSIGNKKAEIAQIGRVLKNKNAAWYTTIIYASASDNCALQYIAPFSSACLGQFYRDQGLNSLVILDDLTKHAIAYQQLSLLMKKAPSREAYPGDIFYLHSRLLERAAQMNKKNNYGTMTMLPIIETQQENFSAFIPTNVISITDGQIYLSRELFRKGIIPSVDMLKSVSRIGAKAQNSFLSWSGTDIRSIFFNYFIAEESLRTGQQLNKLQRYNYNKGKAGLGIWGQREFKNRETSVEVLFNIILSIDYLCINNSQENIYSLYENIQKNLPILLHLILKILSQNNKQKQKLFEKLILNIIYKFIKNL